MVIAAALETDAGRGWVSTEGAVEARVAPIFGPPAYGWVDAHVHVPAEWGNSVVLIIRKPEES